MIDRVSLARMLRIADPKMQSSLAVADDLFASLDTAGYCIVPKEATDEMVAEADDMRLWDFSTGYIWQAMVAKAQEGRGVNLYLISQTANDGYDTYDSAIVCAANPDEAQHINPAGDWDDKWIMDAWCTHPSQVTVVQIGVADEKTEPGVVLASFNAG